MVTTLLITFSDAQGQLTLKSVMESCRNSNSSELLWLVLLSARMKKIHSKMKVLEWSQHFSHNKSMGIFPDAQGQLTHESLVQSCRILNPFEILWGSLLTARKKKIQSKMKELERSQHYSLIFSDAQGQLTAKSVTESCRNSNSSELLWLVLLSARMTKIHPKMKVLEWSQHFSYYKSMGIYPEAQGQLTHKSLVQSCLISNPFVILWLYWLPARIKKNQSKMKELEWSQGFPHYNHMGAICCHGVLIRSSPKPNAVNPPPQ